VDRWFDEDLRAAAASRPALDLSRYLELRREQAERFRALNEEPTDVEVHRPQVPRRRGGGLIDVRVYRRPSAPAGTAATVLVHGGGFVFGSADTVHSRAVALCRELGYVILTLSYRLAPEHPFPAALDDVDDVLDWVVAHAGGLGVDSAAVAVSGYSAGAGISLGVALKRRDEGRRLPRVLHLAAPVLDDRLATVSVRDSAGCPSIDRTFLALAWDYYLGSGHRGGSDVSPYAAPARCEDLSGLPPIHLTVTQHDPLRDENLSFAGRLAAAGNPVEAHLLAGGFHGAYLVEGTAIANREWHELTFALTRALGSPDHFSHERLLTASSHQPGAQHRR
jgi:acetyl esterase